MTVCVAIKVHDCIVFAADSASSLSATDTDGKQRIVNIYENANKVFCLRKGFPICGMTAGIGNFGNVSISTLSKDLRLRFCTEGDDLYLDPHNYSMQEVSEKARVFLFEESFLKKCPDQQGSFDFWIGGYGSAADLGEIWLLQIRDGECPAPICKAPQDDCTIEWGGQPEAINRLLLGYGQALPSILSDVGLSGDQVEKLTLHIAQRSHAQLMHAAMPTIDAIELAEFLVETTKRFVKFLPGGNTVGGATDIATVTKHEGFKWISRKHFYDRKLNPLETDHA